MDSDSRRPPAASDWDAAELATRYNVRDLGGCTTAGGRRVLTGLVYRSAAPCQLSATARGEFARLGVRLVLDLRSNVERNHAPGELGVETWMRDYESSGADLVRDWQTADLTAKRASALMTEVYRAMPEEQAEAIAELFWRIAAGSLPLLIHCAAGKDRTGVAAALLLASLGVPREAVESDFLRTRGDVGRALLETKAAMTRIGADVSRAGVLERIAHVYPDYLQAMFDAVDERHGSVAGYVHDRLKLDRAVVEAVRRQMLD